MTESIVQSLLVPIVRALGRAFEPHIVLSILDYWQTSSLLWELQLLIRAADGETSSFATSHWRLIEQIVDERNAWLEETREASDDADRAEVIFSVVINHLVVTAPVDQVRSAVQSCFQELAGVQERPPV